MLLYRVSCNHNHATDVGKHPVRRTDEACSSGQDRIPVCCMEDSGVTHYTIQEQESRNGENFIYVNARSFNDILFQVVLDHFCLL